MTTEDGARSAAPTVWVYTAAAPTTARRIADAVARVTGEEVACADGPDDPERTPGGGDVALVVYEPGPAAEAELRSAQPWMDRAGRVVWVRSPPRPGSPVVTSPAVTLAPYDLVVRCGGQHLPAGGFRPDEDDIDLIVSNIQRRPPREHAVATPKWPGAALAAAAGVGAGVYAIVARARRG